MRASREVMRAVKGYIAKLGVVGPCEGHMMKVKRKNLEYIFIGKFIRFGRIYLALFNIFISL